MGTQQDLGGLEAVCGQARWAYPSEAWQATYERLYRAYRAACARVREKRLIHYWPYAAFVAFCCTGLLWLHLSPPSPSDRQESVYQDPNFRTDLDCRDFLSLQRLLARNRVANQVLTGQLSLIQAAASFRALNESAVDFNWQLFRADYRGSSDNERCCRQVIFYVQSQLPADSPESEAISAKLEDELQLCMLGRSIAL
jgi:hypothetical protein